MAETIHSAIHVTSRRVVESIETLARSLDDLLERYLELLHQYQTLQQGLAQQLSAGYLSLAQANFSNQSRIRYGQDYYDERMQASSTVSIEAGTSPSFAISAPLSLESPVRSDLEENEPLHSSKETPDSAGENIAANSESKVAKKSPRDPLDWFGILVPPTLRTSQGKFRAAVTGNIPALANVVKDMRELEIEVGRTRKKMRKAS